MEPRNIGVILWTDGAVAARFMRAADAKRLVADVQTYQRWVNFWESEVQKGLLKLNGKAVSKESPSFLTELQKTAKGNYALYEAGFVTDRISGEDMDDAVDFLFAELVHAPASQKENAAEPEDFKTTCDRLFQNTDLFKRPDFMKSYEVPFKAYGVLRHFTFDYGFGDVAHPKSIFQRVLLARHQSVESTAFALEWFAKSPKRVEKSHRGVIVDTSAAQLKPAQVESGVAILESLATVVDLSNPDRAAESLLEIAGTNGDGVY